MILPLPTPKKIPLTSEGLNTVTVWKNDNELIHNSSIGGKGLYVAYLDGSVDRKLLIKDEEGNVTPSSYSPGGNVLAYWGVHPETKSDIWILHLEDNTREPFLASRFNEHKPKSSPEGKWVAYVSDDSPSGQDEVFVRPYPVDPSQVYQISENGGTFPVWNPQGGELFFINLDLNKLMKVDIETVPKFKKKEEPKELFSCQFPKAKGHSQTFDYDPENDRFFDR